MPTYQAGDHKIDHPPLFACREHKQFLKLTESFVKEILAIAGDIVPANLSEVAGPMLGGSADGFKLPDYLIPPRLVLYNPDFLKGPAALPFTIVFIDKRFVGIPAKYLTQDKFEGCAECDLSPLRDSAQGGSASGSGAVPKASGAPVMRAGAAPTRSPSGSGPVPAAGPAKRPGISVGPGTRPAGTEGSGIIRRGPPPPPGTQPSRPAPRPGR